jgi:iron complex transport system substrate-binding protein
MKLGYSTDKGSCRADHPPAWRHAGSALARSLLVLLMLLCGIPAMAREIVDMAGRKVVIPDKVTRVFGSAPPLNVLLNAVAPEMMIGLSFKIDEPAKKFFTPRARELPVVGGVFGLGQQMSPETVLALQPDLALAWKSPFVDQAKIEEAFARMGIPVVFISLDTLADWPRALRFTGRLLGHGAAAETEAAYVEKALAKLAATVGKLPENRRPRVYYAEGTDGLVTDCNRSFHTEAIELAGGYNVYRCQSRDHLGMEKVSIEQVLVFDPEIIIVQDRPAAAAIRSDPRWQGVRAVRAGRIHLVPRWPHNWVDRPPSAVRALGAQWLAKLFHPDLYPFDVRRETRDFYRLFFGVVPSDSDIDELLSH